MGRDRDRLCNKMSDIAISIHAPRVGRDRLAWYKADFTLKDFNPRAPCGARPEAKDTLVAAINISIHAPRVGRDARWRVPACGTSWISIHAPRVGRDAACENQYPAGQHFNPRAPCGARQHRKLRLLGALRFQSTRPVWGATIVTLDKVAEMTISIHAPRVGRDLSICDAVQFSMLISIHAPRVGRDNSKFPVGAKPKHFNPRAPCGARQHRRAYTQNQSAISIHAPRVGRDYTHDAGLFARRISIHAPHVGRDYL